MKKVLSVLIIAILVIALISLPLASASSENSQGKQRFIVKTTNPTVLNAFESKGCEVKYVFTFSSALDCPPGVGKAYKLQEDIKVFAVDAAANTQIGADLVHAAGYDGTGRIVAVLDTGIDYNHPELSTSYPGGKDFVNKDNDPLDDHGHGTFVSGLITADGLDANAKGTAPAAKVWAGKVLDSTGSGFFSDVIAAINHVTNNVHPTTPVDAISMSLGTSPPYTFKGKNCDGLIPDLDKAINDAITAGISVVAAAGNNGGAGISVPGCISGVDTVGAVDINDVRASFSGKGESLDVMALGVNDYSTKMGGGYRTASGTSASTPIVSAVIALMNQKDSSLAPGAITNILRTTAVDLGPAGFDNEYGYGRVNAKAAMDAIASVTPDFSISANPTSLTISINSSGESTITVTALNGFIGTVNLEASTSSIAISASLLPTSVELTSTTTSATSKLTVTSGSTISDFSVTVTGTSGSLSRSTTVSVKVASAPSAPQNLAANAGDSNVRLTWQAPASDGNSPITNYNIYRGTTSGGETFLTQVGNVLEYTNTGLTNGQTYYYQVTAVNSIGESARSNEASATPQASPTSTGAMYVWSIDFSTKFFGPKGSYTDVMTTVTIKQDSDNDATAESTDANVAKARVEMKLIRDSNNDGVFDPAVDESWNFAGDTGDNGSVTFTLKFAKNGNYKAEVTNVTHATLTYDSSLNVKTSGTTTVNNTNASSSPKN